MVAHHTASLITANACGRSEPLARSSRSIVSRIAVMVQSSAPAAAGVSPTFSRFHATRQRAEQNRACSRRGANVAPHCAQSLVSLTTSYVTRNLGPDLRGARVGRMNTRWPDGVVPGYGTNLASVWIQRDLRRPRESGVL